MKTMKLKLADGKIYVFSTFTMRQRKGMRELYKKMSKFQDEVQRSRYEVDDKGKFKKDNDGLFILKDKTEEENLDVLDIEEKMIPLLIDIFRKSISRNHKEFKTDGGMKNEDVEDLVDIEDLKNISSFSMTGIPPFIEANEYDFSDLEVKSGSITLAEESDE